MYIHTGHRWAYVSQIAWPTICHGARNLSIAAVGVVTGGAFVAKGTIVLSVALTCLAVCLVAHFIWRILRSQDTCPVS